MQCGAVVLAAAHRDDTQPTQHGEGYMSNHETVGTTQLCRKQLCLYVLKVFLGTNRPQQYAQRLQLLLHIKPAGTTVLHHSAGLAV